MDDLDPDVRPTSEATADQPDKSRRPLLPSTMSPSSPRLGPAGVDLCRRTGGVFGNVSTHKSKGVVIEHADTTPDAEALYDIPTQNPPDIKSKGKAPARSEEHPDFDNDLADHVAPGHIPPQQGLNRHLGEEIHDKPAMTDNDLSPELPQNKSGEHPEAPSSSLASGRPRGSKKRVSINEREQQPWQQSYPHGEPILEPLHYTEYGYPGHYIPYPYQTAYSPFYPSLYSLPPMQDNRHAILDSQSPRRRVKSTGKRKKAARSDSGASHKPTLQATIEGMLSSGEGDKTRRASPPPTGVSSQQLSGSASGLPQATPHGEDPPPNQAESLGVFLGEGDDPFAPSSSRSDPDVDGSNMKERAWNTLQGSTTHLYDDLPASRGPAKRRNRKRQPSQEHHHPHRPEQAALTPAFSPWFQYGHAPSLSAYHVGLPAHTQGPDFYIPRVHSRMPEHANMAPHVEAVASQASVSIEPDFDERETHDSTAKGLIMAVSVQCSYATLHSRFSSLLHSSWPERAAQIDDGSVHVRRAISAKRFKKRDGSHSVELSCEDGPSLTDAKDGHPIQWL
jgi:hypothetical protein